LNYIDTSIIIILLDRNDTRFYEANKVISEEDPVMTDMGMFEFISFLSRNNLENPIAYAYHTLQKYNIKLLSLVNSSFLMGFGSINSLFYNAMELSEKIKLRTLNLLHVSYCIYLKNINYEIKNLFTADKEFGKSEKTLWKYGINLMILQ
jgi:predicted nucleic acid-binding protein